MSQRNAEVLAAGTSHNLSEVNEVMAEEVEGNEVVLLVHLVEAAELICMITRNAEKRRLEA